MSHGTWKEKILHITWQTALQDKRIVNPFKDISIEVGGIESSEIKMEVFRE